MKKNIYQSIIILILFLSIPYIKADCTTEEIKELKKETKQIKIIYEHIDNATTEEGGTDYNKLKYTYYKVNVKWLHTTRH